MADETYHTRPEDIVPLKRKFFYALGSIPDPVFMGTIGNFLVMFYNTVLGVPAGLVGLIIFVPRIWDAVTDPYFGKLSDNCKSRHGRRRPYILIGGLLAIVTYVLLWTPPGEMSSTGYAVYLLIVGCVFFTAFTAYVIPYGALAIELSPDYNERTMIYAVRNIITSIGQAFWSMMPLLMGYFTLKFGGAGHERAGYGMAALVLAAACIIPIVLCFVGTRERPAAKLAAEMSFGQSLKYTLKNKYFVRLAAAVFSIVLAVMTLAAYVNYLFMYYLEKPELIAIIGGLSAVLGMTSGFVWWGISYKIGKPHTLFLAQLLLFVAAISILFVFNRDYPYLSLVYGVLNILGWSGLMVMASAVMADVTDLDELETGKRREGSYGGIFGFIFKMGVAASTPVLGLGLQYVIRFDEKLGAQNTPETFWRLQLTTAIISCLFMGIALVLLWRFPLTRQRAIEVRRELERRRGERHALA